MFEIKRRLFINGKEVTDKQYSAEFLKQVLLYGSAINSTSLIKNEYCFNLIDYKKVWKSAGLPEPI